jgi:hypothetical protein
MTERACRLFVDEKNRTIFTADCAVRLLCLLVYKQALHNKLKTRYVNVRENATFFSDLFVTAVDVGGSPFLGQLGGVNEVEGQSSL